jgi:hypothetical protein
LNTFVTANEVIFLRGKMNRSAFASVVLFDPKADHPVVTMRTNDLSHIMDEGGIIFDIRPPKVPKNNAISEIHSTVDNEPPVALSHETYQNWETDDTCDLFNGPDPDFDTE